MWRTKDAARSLMSGAVAATDKGMLAAEREAAKAFGIWEEALAAETAARSAEGRRASQLARVAGASW